MQLGGGNFVDDETGHLLVGVVNCDTPRHPPPRCWNIDEIQLIGFLFIVRVEGERVVTIGVAEPSLVVFFAVKEVGSEGAVGCCGFVHRPPQCDVFVATLRDKQLHQV